MKGLLIKDFKLMKNMKNSLLIIAVIAVGMAGYLKDLTFLIVYLALLGATFTTSTLSYDEFDNGYAFLFCLPVERKGYVAEKYGFGLIMSGGGWLMGSLLAAAGGVMRGTASVGDTAMASLAMLPVPLILLAVLLPLHLKFGGEKGRLVMFCMAGALAIAGLVGVKAAEMLHLDLDALLESLSAMSMGMAAAAGAAAAAALLALSCRVSMGIVKKWEF